MTMIKKKWGSNLHDEHPSPKMCLASCYSAEMSQQWSNEAFQNPK